MKKKSPKKRKNKAPGITHFGRCTPAQRAKCQICSPEGKELCASMRRSMTRDPRRRLKGKDDRDYTPIPHESLRWSLGSRYDYLRVTYAHLLSWTTDNSNLVYRSVKSLAIERNISLGSYYKHLSLLKKLELIEILPRAHVARYGRNDEYAVYLLPLPRWVNNIVETLSYIATESSKSTGATAKRRLNEKIKRLKAKQEEVLNMLNAESDEEDPYE